MQTKELLKKVRHIELITRGLVNQVFSGEYHSVFKGRGMEFSEVREYQFGDDIRSIDWNVTARFDHPFVKIFEEERELTVMLAVDMSGSQYFGSTEKTKQEVATEISAILAFSALKNNDKVGLLLFSDKVEKFIPPAKKKTHVLRIIRELLDFEPTGKKTDIKLALEYISTSLKKRSIVFLISDFFDEGYDKALRIVGRKHDLVGIVLSDEREKALPPVGLVKILDPESGREFVLDTNDKQFREHFRKEVIRKEAERSRLFNVSRLDTVKISMQRSYIQPLVMFFKRRAARW